MGEERYRRALESWRPLGRALLAYHEGREDSVLHVHGEDGVPEPVPASLFFRGTDRMEDWELEALTRCRGRILDVGAGAGAHALVLQERGLEVVALELLPEAARILRERGVKRVMEGTLEEAGRAISGEGGEASFDTALLLMSGSNFAGTAGGLGAFFRRLERVLVPGGQVLLDSTDLREPGGEGEPRLPDGRYLGELHYQLEFDGEKGSPFPHLFVDPDLLAEEARRAGWSSEVVWENGDGVFLAKLCAPSRAPAGPPPGRPGRRPRGQPPSG